MLRQSIIAVSQRAARRFEPPAVLVVDALGGVYRWDGIAYRWSEAPA